MVLNYIESFNSFIISIGSNCFNEIRWMIFSQLLFLTFNNTTAVIVVAPSLSKIYFDKTLLWIFIIVHAGKIFVSVHVNLWISVRSPINLLSQVVFLIESSAARYLRSVSAARISRAHLRNFLSDFSSLNDKVEIWK